MIDVILLYIFITLVQNICCSFDKELLLEYTNLQCKDNNDLPVDWWYIYKPPAKTGPYFESGSNFTYITSHSLGRWEASTTNINYYSMVQFTLLPLLENIKQKHIAVLSYGDYNIDITEIDLQKSTAFGVIFGNNEGGVWISHTVPDFPDFTKNDAFFPEEEFSEGHMIVCFTLKLPDMDVIAAAVQNTQPNIVKFILPEYLVPYLPHWESIASPSKMGNDTEKKTKIANFVTQEKSLRGVILARGPGDSRCLYTRFAKLRQYVIDVYSNELYHVPVECKKEFSLRHIDAISLKFPDDLVYYINNKTDRISFGISTAATWQSLGQGTPQYWTCTGNTDAPGSLAIKGALIICVYNYHIWSAFDNLKIKEPSC